MPYIQEIITAGLVKEVRKYHSYKYQAKREQRGERQQITPEEMIKINECNAERKLRILLNANFREDDFYLTLTYQGEMPDAKQARKNFSKFTRRVRDFYKKKGISLKYVGVTEYEGKRIHHHVLINAADGVKMEWYHKSTVPKYKERR